MHGALTILEGGDTLRQTLSGQAGMEGAFYNWPLVGQQLTMFVTFNDELTTLTTSQVQQVVVQTPDQSEFICKDGRFRLNKLSNQDGMLEMQ